MREPLHPSHPVLHPMEQSLEQSRPQPLKQVWVHAPLQLVHPSQH